MKSPLDAYMQYALRFPLLSKEETHSLILEYSKNKSIDLRNKLMNHNLRLVVKLAFKYKGAPTWDLIQEGNIGLIRAIEKFDPGKGVTFGYYAYFWIRARMLRFIVQNSRPVKCTNPAVSKLFFSLSKTKAKLEAQGIDISDEELAEQIGVKTRDITNFNLLFSPVRSLFPNASEKALSGHEQQQYDCNHGVNLSERMDIDDAGYDVPDSLLERKRLSGRLDIAMKQFASKLNDNQKIVLERRFTNPDIDTLDTIAKDIDLTRQRVHQIEKGLRNKLTKFLSNREISLNSL